MKATPALGIDFGTTKTLVSYLDTATGRPVAVRMGRGSDYIPSTAYVAEGGEFLFGDTADDLMEQDCLRYCRGFKMKLGSSAPVLGFEENGRYCCYSALELTREFFRYIRQECEQCVFMGRQVHRAVVTCPVSFSPAQRADLKSAAEQAGFQEVQLLSEPEAAGLAFCRLCPEGAFSGSALVIDWGGGTLDMALVSRQGESISIYRDYTQGGADMGGERFDERLWQFTREHLLSVRGIDIEAEPPEVQGRVQNRLRKEKELLSRQRRSKVFLSGSSGPLPPFELERSDFERLIADDVERAARMASVLCDSIREDTLRPQCLILVGGSSLVPCIAEKLGKGVGLRCYPWQYPREAVSFGAALTGASADGQQEADRAVQPPPKHELSLKLTPIEMLHGCTKAFTLKGRRIEITLPAGMAPGRRLRLSGEKAQGLGTVILTIVAAEEEGAVPRPDHLEHTLLLSPQEMAAGCVKTFTMQGKMLEVRVPAGVRDGSRLRLSREKTQGLGVVILLVAQQNPPAAEPAKATLEHSLGLTLQEMRAGCTKKITLQGKELEVRVPAGVRDGSRLRLSREKTQGLGVVILRVLELASDPPPHRPEARPDDERTRVEARVKSLISEQLGVDVHRIELCSRLMEDLGADSLDTVELLIALEDAFSIEVPDEDADKLRTVSDIVDYIMFLK